MHGNINVKINVRLVIECILFWLQTENSGYLFEFPKSCVSLLWVWVEQNVFFTTAQQPPVGQGLLTLEASRSHSDTPHSLLLLWMCDQHNAETSTWQHTTIPREKERETSMTPAGFEPTIPASERPQTHALDRAATGTGKNKVYSRISRMISSFLRKLVLVQNNSSSAAYKT
jgi:hypothetical protein